MAYLQYFLLVAGVFLLMEGVAWFTHKYVMHGFLWYLHRDHHQKEPGFFERNDAFFLIFALPSIASMIAGVEMGNPWLICVSVGIMLYGMAYFLVHDVIIHQRFKWFSRSRNKYVRVLRWAHKMHHKHLEKEHGESFGMLIVAARYWNKIREDDRRAKGI